MHAKELVTWCSVDERTNYHLSDLERTRKLDTTLLERKRFIWMRFQLSTLKRYVWVFIWIHFRERFQIDALFYENAYWAFWCGRKA